MFRSPQCTTIPLRLSAPIIAHWFFVPGSVPPCPVHQMGHSGNEPGQVVTQLPLVTKIQFAASTWPFRFTMTLYHSFTPILLAGLLSTHGQRLPALTDSIRPILLPRTLCPLHASLHHSPPHFPPFAEDRFSWRSKLPTAFRKVFGDCTPWRKEHTLSHMHFHECV